MANVNTDYLITILQSDTGVRVTAPMPEEFMFDSASSYEAPFAQGLFGNSAVAQLAKVGGMRLSSQALTAQIWQGSNDTQLSVELDFQTETDPINDVRDPILALLKLTTPSMDPTKGIMLAPGPQLDTSLAGQIVSELAGQVVDTSVQVINTLGGNIKTDQGKMKDSSTSVPNGAGTQAVSTSGAAGQGGYWKTKIKNQISIQIGNYAFFDSVVITNVQKTYTSNFDYRTGLPMHAKVQVQFKPLFQLLQSDLDAIFKSPKIQRPNRS